jgi:hypothetical protein
MPAPLPRRCLALLAALVVWGAAAGQAKKPENPNAPRVLLAAPLGAAPGAMVRVTLRGLKLDQVTALRFHDAKIAAKVLRKGKSVLPQKNPAKVGDTELVAEVKIPAGTSGGSASFVAVSPAGESKPHGLLVETTLPVVAEKEPNNGFRQAQPIRVPQAVDGLIAQPKDVDVFRFEGKAGQKVVCEVLAARHGSELDSILTLYDAEGHEVAANDDSGGSTDSRVEATLPKAGTYYLSLMDAHDQGGPAHVYRLLVRAGK